MSYLNKAMVIGNLGKNPEVRYTQGGSAVATLSVATTETWKDKQTGEKKEKTEWHKVTMFGRLAEIAGEYLHSGDKVYVEGRLETQKWQDKEGRDRYTTSIVADTMKMLSTKRNTDGANSRAHQQEKSQGASQQSMAPDFDDDIPF